MLFGNLFELGGKSKLSETIVSGMKHIIVPNVPFSASKFKLWRTQVNLKISLKRGVECKIVLFDITSVLNEFTSIWLFIVQLNLLKKLWKEVGFSYLLLSMVHEMLLIAFFFLIKTNITDDTSPVLAFLAGALIGGRNYRLRLDVKVYGYTDSFSEYNFITNLPPYGGECMITPETGNHCKHFENTNSTSL